MTILVNETTPILGDVCYTLDTSSMTWKKQEISGQGRGALYGHSGINKQKKKKKEV